MDSLTGQKEVPLVPPGGCMSEVAEGVLNEGGGS